VNGEALLVTAIMIVLAVRREIWKEVVLKS
jgi:hypothetical protein